MSSIGSSLSSSYLQSIFNVLESAGVTKGATGSTNSVGQQGDNTQLSPFAQLMSTLQQLQQSDPTKYAQVTQQIATNLQNAAQTAQSEGNSTAANQLNQLATDFSNASQTGQLPNIQDLAQALGGGGHRHHHHGDDSSSDSSSSSSSSGITSSSNTTQALSQLLSALQSNQTQSDATQNNTLNPMAIIINTLSTAGVTNNSNN